MIDLIGLGLVAGVIPVYLGIGVALALGKILPRSWLPFVCRAAR